MDIMKKKHEENIFQGNIQRARFVRLHGGGDNVMKIADLEEYPELENDHARSRVVLGILEEFPSIRRDVWTYLKDMHPDELRRVAQISP
jgi:hypothetical protein